jgi:8-oxo-dGTP pyrophosphatase MutT (NUDIX family)
MTSLPKPLRARTLFPVLAEHLRSRSRRTLSTEGVSESSVLITLFERDDDVFMWLLKRPDTMRRHSGQVAFPGGKRDASDSDLWHTALREAEEEMGIRPDHVERMGVLDDLITGTGFVITPHVVSLDPSFAPDPSPSEVARVIMAPLRIFNERATGVFPRVGHTIDGELVWGATFAIARSLAEIAAVALRPASFG